MSVGGSNGVDAGVGASVGGSGGVTVSLGSTASSGVAPASPLGSSAGLAGTAGIQPQYDAEGLAEWVASTFSGAGATPLTTAR